MLDQSKKSIMYKLNPLTKVSFTSVICFFVIYLRFENALIAGFAYLILIMIMGRISIFKMEKMLRFMYIMILLSFILGYFLGVNLGPLIKVSLRFLLLFALSLTFAFTTDSDHMIATLNSILTPFRLIRMPISTISLLIDTTIRFFPKIIEDTYTMMEIQRLKGLFKGSFKGKISYIKSLIIIIMLNIVNNARIISIAIYTRGFSLNNKRSRYIKNDIHFYDIILILLSLSTLSLPYFLSL